jgi:hypothetical protein
MLLAMLGPLGANRALAASVASASFTNGGLVAGGTRYAKQGQTVTLSIATTPDTRCVRVTGDHTGKQTTASGQSSWTFSFTVSSGDGPRTVSVEAGTTPTGGQAACNGIGAPLGTASYTRDNTGPSVTANLVPAPNAAGWNNSDVTLNWVASDSGVGMVGGSASGPTPAGQLLTANGNYNLSSVATDALGNLSPNNTGKVVVHLDKTLPTISGARSPAANSFGWNNTDVSVTFNCSDPGQFASGIASCGPAALLNSETTSAGQTVSGTAVDIAGNQSNAQVGPIKIDRTNPTLTGAATTLPNGNGWYNDDVVIEWTPSDGLSGIDLSTVPTDSTITGEGSNLGASESVQDKAGNVGTDSVSGIMIDRTAPQTAASAPSGWSNTNVTVSLDATDNLSGVAATNYELDGAPGTGDSVLVADGVHTLEYWSVDNAGNEEAHQTITVSVDTIRPDINHILNPQPNANGWNNSASVAVEFVCSDNAGGSGVLRCGPDQSVSAEGIQTVTGTAVDNAGNIRSEDVEVKIDRTAPTISGDRSPAANAFGWNNTDVSVTFECADTGGSGIASPDGCAGSTTLTGETPAAGQTVTGTATDDADNQSSAQVGPIKIDKTNPTLTGAATDAPNGNGWYNDDVVIQWTPSDSLSGIDPSTVPADSTITGEGSNLGASESVQDQAGNMGTGSVSGIMIDRIAPMISASASGPTGSNGWYVGPVTVHFTCSDGLSGIATCPADIVLSGDGAGQSASGTAVDNAGNTAAAAVTGINIDQTAPSVTGSRTPAANANGWNNGPVTVSFSCADATSGLAAAGGCSGPTTLSGEGAGQSVTGSAVDNAGNTASDTVGQINIDLTAPTISGAATTSPNANGWYNGNVTVHWTCGDNLSGVGANCHADSVITGEGSNLLASASVSDLAGNSANASVAGINIDRTKPVLALPANTTVNASSLSGAVVSYSASASDALSGFASGPTTTPTCTRSDGQPGYTFAAGTTTTVTCSATDKTGNTATGSFTVTVNPFYFQGFFQPIDNGNVWNTIKGGQTVPVKWKLYLYQGGPEITSTASVAAGWPRYASAACTALPQDAVETTSTGSTNLRYDTTSQQFIYNWQTPAGSGCYRLDVKFTDGRTYSAQFQTSR